MSQSTSARKLSPNEKMYQKLIKRSLDAFTLALEMYNRPSLCNRVEAFTIMQALTVQSENFQLAKVHIDVNLCV